MTCDWVPLAEASTLSGVALSTIKYRVRTGKIAHRRIPSGRKHGHQEVRVVRVTDIEDLETGKKQRRDKHPSFTNPEAVDRREDMRHDYDFFRSLGMCHDSACRRVADGYGVGEQIVRNVFVVVERQAA